MDIHARYLNPLSDFGFKKLFGEEPNKDILIALLNDLLPDTPPIVDLQYMKTERLGLTEFDRRSFYDLYCTADTGERFIVELQKERQPNFQDRAVFYSSYLIQSQGERGDWDFRLYPVYTICIMNFGLPAFLGSSDHIHHVTLKDERNQQFSDKIQYLFIELSKFDKEADQLESPVDKWLYLFRHLSNLKDRPAALQDRVFDRLFKAAQVGKLTREERHSYEVDLKHYRDYMNVMRDKRQAGIEQGRNEQAIQTAEVMLLENEPLEKIIRFTGLSEAEIIALRKNKT